MPYVSVVIPCYNAEKYIDRCMECLKNQTIGFENLEIIFVNDGSLDTTLGKLMFYENQYPDRIILVNIPVNGGQGAAKNVGFGYATAEFAAFLDVDDVIADSFYEKLYSKINEKDYDWVSAKFVQIAPNETPDFREPISKNDKEYRCAKGECLLFQTIDSGMLNGKFGILPARIFRRKFLLDNQIYFPEGLMYEDNYWGAKCNVFAKHIYIIDEVLYCYYINSNSVVSSRNAAYHLDRMKIEEMLLDLFKEQGLFEKYHMIIEKRFLQMYYCATWFAIFMKMDTIPEILPVMRAKIYENFPDFWNNSLIQKFGPLDKTLLKLLEPEEVYTVEELQIIKEGYVKDYLRMSAE